MQVDNGKFWYCLQNRCSATTTQSKVVAPFRMTNSRPLALVTFKHLSLSEAGLIGLRG